MPYTHGCLMATFDIPEWEDLVTNMIDPSDIYKVSNSMYGLELEPHVTILYGFKPGVDVNKIKQFSK